MNFWVLAELDIEKNPVKIYSAAEERCTLVYLIRVGENRKLSIFLDVIIFNYLNSFKNIRNRRIE